MAKTTSNLGLKKPERGDVIFDTLEQLGDNFGTIDAEIKTIKDGKLPYFTYSNQEIDFNNLTTIGFHVCANTCTYTNCPESSGGTLICLYYSGTFGMQIWVHQFREYIWIRRKYNHAWQTWKKIVTEDTVAEAISSTITSGMILMWSGAADKIPSGWLLCNGTSGTPDLRNRFIVGAGDEYAVGNTGGAKEVTLTTAEIPSHTHTYYISTQGDTTNPATSNRRYATGSEEATTETTGGGEAHENRPPYYALCYIMKA